MQTTPPTAIANTAAAGSVGLAGATWVTDLNTIMQMTATGVAIIAGLTAIIWHVEKIRQARRERRDDKVDEGQGKR